VQRRYRSQRAKPEYDATIDFDLRTALPGAGPPKLQPRWLDAAFGALVEKGGTNYQIQMGVVFDYGRSVGLDTPGAIKQIEQAWLACRPLVDLARRIKS